MKFLDYLYHHQIKVLIFDKDGTLTDTSALWLEPTLQVIEALLARNGMRLDKEENRTLYEKLGITSSEIIENSVIASGSVRDMLEVIAQFGEFDIEENYQFTVQFFYHYITSNPDKIIALGNVKKTLQRFKELGFTLALVTNDSKLPTKAVLEVLKVESLFDFIGTTLVGYTSQSEGDKIEANDFEIIRKALAEIQHPLIAEGNIDSPEKVKRVLELGAFSVVVGSAITRPQLITRKFADATKE